MDGYLAEFRERLKKHMGSLVKVASVKDPYARQFLGELARGGAVERVAWGWYYVPSNREPASAMEFLAADRNYKVLTGQTAASFWNGDFIHREVVSLAVEDPSYKRALEAFARRRGWSVEADFDKDARKIPHKRIGALLVEDREHAIVDCMQRWAFVDAVAAMSPRSPGERLRREAYWTRISGTDVRVGQALEYAAHRLFEAGRDVRISDDFVREELDEAIERVKQFGA